MCAQSGKVPNKLTRREPNVSNPYVLLNTDLMGPISPAALGDFQYVSMFTNEHTKWTEVFLV